MQRFVDGTYFAIKKIRLLQGNTDAKSHLDNELYAGKKLGKHPHIVQLIDSKENKLKTGSGNDKEVYLLFELCTEGNLASLIESRKSQGQTGL